LADWPVEKPGQAKAFYSAIAIATVLGAAANVLKISLIKALIWAAALNAVVAVPVMFLTMKIATNTKIMGPFRIQRARVVLGWLATGVMAIASIAFLVSLATG
jgi:Mn2+/Fe2+ NRAMP family transporter